VNREDFEDFQQKRSEPRISASSFDYKRGTLLYGYTCDRDIFHVYLDAGYIHRLIYREERNTLIEVEYDWFTAWDAHRLVPDKRAYPESTDLLMATLLRDAGVDVAYLPFDEKRYARSEGELFHGLTKGDFQ
jgi:hypothetical protein